MSYGWILTLVAVVVAVCAVLAAFGFKGRVSTVGVDLGTTFSVVGVSINGKVKIIQDEEGNRLFPSVVAYLENGDILTAHKALPYMSLKPASTIFNAKRFIGKSKDDEEFQSYASAHPFKVVPVDSPAISNYSKVGFEVSIHNEKQIIAPEQVGTQVLKYLMEVTADFLGHEQVNKAVIAVPAKFTPLQRQATGEAYKKAGLKVVRVLEEPTAAAVAYRLHKRKDIHHILVYDFGGGTLDVSLLYVSKGSVQVYATDGDDTLGGSDLDYCLYDIIKGQIEETSGQPVITLEEYMIQSENASSKTSKSTSKKKKLVENENDVKDICLSTNLRNKAEHMKKLLSSQEEVTLSCLSNQKSSENITFTVTKGDFESKCSHLFDRAMAPVSRLLSDLEMRREEIDEIVLVGGSTRIPKIKSMLREYFNKELNDHIDPDVTVAYGAASILD